MQTFIIDPETRSITEAETDGSIQDIYKLIGCNLIDIVMLNDAEDVLYVDDEGLYNSPHFFKFGDYPNPLAGKSLVLGTDSEGESTEPTLITLEELEASVTFISRETAIGMAEAAEAEARALTPEIEARGFSHVIMSAADIIRDSSYNEESEGAE
jgi:hypothetical protein